MGLMRNWLRRLGGLYRDIWGRFFFVPLGHSGTDLGKDCVQNVSNGQKTSPIGHSQ